MSHEIMNLIKETYANAKEVIDRFIAAYKKIIAFFNKEEETAETAETAE